LSGLLPIQQWYLEREDVGVSHFNQSILLGIDKSVTEEALTLAIEQLVVHHDALRFSYQRTGDGNNWQQEYSTATGAVITEDIQAAAAASLSSLIREHADKYQRSLAIEKGELIRVVLLQTPRAETHNRLFIVIHHLAVDGVSWRILLEDLELLLTGLSKGDKVKLGNKSSSYRQWYHALEQYGQTKSLVSQKVYWQNAVESYQPLPVDKQYSEVVKARDTGHYFIHLGATQTQQLLQEVPRVYHTEINDLLLTALAKTLCRWSNADTVTIGLEGHGREDLAAGIDSSRTVGWFTTLYPVLLQAGAANNNDRLIKAVKEQLRQVPDKGLGYGVLKYINKEEALQGKAPWDIIFNYLGQLDNVVRESSWLKGAGESTGASRSEEQVVGEKLAVNSFIRGGELTLNWTYSTKHYEQETIKNIAADYICNLESLILHCLEQQRAGVSLYTPSDYGLTSEITYEELDGFLEESYNGKPRRDYVESLYRLSGLQQGMLFHSLYDGQGGAYTEQFICDLLAVDLEVLTKSWAYIIKHHSVLRSAFYYDQFAVPVQCVYKEVSLPVAVLDYRNISQEEQATALKGYEAADRSQGFDFKRAPLMRLTLIRLTEDRYKMLWTSHHILFDGWSLPILMEEFLSTYETLSSGRQISGEEEDRYEDYIRYIERKDKEEEEKYWRIYMRGVEQPTLLPFIRTTTERTKGAGEYRSLFLDLDIAVTEKIQAYAQKHRLTVNTVMQGVWSSLLHKYTGSRDIVYGVIVSGRPDDLVGVEQRVGLYINALPLHSRVEEGQGVVEWLQALQSDQVTSRQYQYTPLSTIQQWTGVQGDLFDSLLIFENYPVSDVIASRQWRLRVENVQMREQLPYCTSTRAVEILFMVLLSRVVLMTWWE
jgi:non-ribosomal peptide synthase protein (TIGR01720 family)